MKIGKNAYRYMFTQFCWDYDKRNKNNHKNQECNYWIVMIEIIVIILLFASCGNW